MKFFLYCCMFITFKFSPYTCYLHNLLILTSLIKANDVMVFSKTYCPYCTKAKQALSELGVTFNVIELDVSVYIYTLINIYIQLSSSHGEYIPNLSSTFQFTIGSKRWCGYASSVIRADRTKDRSEYLCTWRSFGWLR